MILTVPVDTVTKFDRVSHAFPKMAFSSTRHADVPRKKACSSSITDPLGLQQRTSRVWYPGFVGKCVNPYPANVVLPVSSNSHTCMISRGHPCILAVAKWTSMGWFQTCTPSSSNAAYCVWLESSPARKDHDLPHSRYLQWKTKPLIELGIRCIKCAFFIRKLTICKKQKCLWTQPLHRSLRWNGPRVYHQLGDECCSLTFLWAFHPVYECNWNGG